MSIIKKGLKVVLFTALICAIGGTAFGYGRIKNILDNYGSIIVHHPMLGFYIFAKFPFDDRYMEEIEDLESSLEAILDDAINKIEVDELNSWFYAGEENGSEWHQ